MMIILEYLSRYLRENDYVGLLVDVIDQSPVSLEGIRNTDGVVTRQLGFRIVW